MPDRKCFFRPLKNGTTADKFIDTCLKFCGLDPCHYFSSPGLSWDAMLKMTGVKQEQISDIDIHLFMRGGIAYIVRRYAKANNKCRKIMILKKLQNL